MARYQPVPRLQERRPSKPSKTAVPGHTQKSPPADHGKGEPGRSENLASSFRVVLFVGFGFIFFFRSCGQKKRHNGPLTAAVYGKHAGEKLRHCDRDVACTSFLFLPGVFDHCVSQSEVSAGTVVLVKGTGSVAGIQLTKVVGSWAGSETTLGIGVVDKGH